MPIIGKDYASRKLCEMCWNNAHWSKPRKDRQGNRIPSRNLCQGGGCECPCPQMPADRSGINRTMRDARKRNAAAQMQIPDPGGIPLAVERPRTTDPPERRR